MTEGRQRRKTGDFITIRSRFTLLGCTRRQIRVNKVLVHENFTESVNDIALLRLGKKNLSINLIQKQFTEDRVDISVFRPACLPDVGESSVDQEGHVYGEQDGWSFIFSASQAGEPLEFKRPPQIS